MLRDGAARKTSIRIYLTAFLRVNVGAVRYLASCVERCVTRVVSELIGLRIIYVVNTSMWFSDTALS